MSVLAWISVVAVIGGGVCWLQRRRSTAIATLADSRAAARRWVERLGGQVYSLEPGNDASARQALADAAERFTAAGGQVDQASSAEQFRQAEITAQEGLYYIRAARVSLGFDPGPLLPELPGQQQAGAVSQAKSVTVAGRRYQASSEPGDETPHYYPGGTVAGRPVPRGWYSDPWWQGALASGAWSASSYLVASSLFYGSAGIGWDADHFAGDAAEDDARYEGGGDSGDGGDHFADSVDSEFGDYGDY